MIARGSPDEEQQEKKYQRIWQICEENSNIFAAFMLYAGHKDL